MPAWRMAHHQTFLLFTCSDMPTAYHGDVICGPDKFVCQPAYATAFFQIFSMDTQEVQLLLCFMIPSASETQVSVYN